LEKVLKGIKVAEEIGFPIKINVVAMRGINDDEFIDFAKLTLTKPYAVRFIEYMPTANEEGWQALAIPGHEIIERISAKFPVVSMDKGDLSGPSRDYKIHGAAGTIGVITPISGHFCSECNRIRVTSSGMAKSCLFDNKEYDLRPLLKAGSESALNEAMLQIVRNKPGKHFLSNENTTHEPFDMSKVGG